MIRKIADEDPDESYNKDKKGIASLKYQMLVLELEIGNSSFNRLQLIQKGVN